MNAQGSSPTPNREDVYRLANAALCGEMSQAESAELGALVAGYPAARRWYLEFICDACNLRARAQSQQAADLPAIVVGELESEEGLELFSPRPAVGLFGGMARGTTGYFSNAGPLSYLIATFVMLVMGIVAWNWKLPEHAQVVDRTAPSFETTPGVVGQTRFVGRVTGLVDCQWEEASRFRVQGSGEEKSSGVRNQNSEIKDQPAPRLQSPVSLGDRFALASGLMEITYDTGAKVILQGPCTYEIDSAAGGYLAVGKVTARVEKQEERRTKDEGLSDSRSSFPIPHSYFAIRTPTALVTDLGTEFGVEVSEQGDTMSHVFRGSVEMRPVGMDEGDTKGARVLHADESARVGRAEQGRVTTPGPNASIAFVREMPRRKQAVFDLLDAIAGGDGLSGKRDAGIDPTNGRLLTISSAKTTFPVGDGKYHRVEGCPFVDGVFIPDGRRGPVRISSSGLTFAGFPPTANGASGEISVGNSTDARPFAGWNHYPAVLDGVDYSQPDRGALYLHANKGITFDLDAIRRVNPDQRIRRFRTVAGNTETESAKGRASTADLWVLIDGAERFSRQRISQADGAFDIVVSIVNTDRWLTLAATDGGDGIGADWIVFGSPRLELTPAARSTGSTSQ